MTQQEALAQALHARCEQEWRRKAEADASVMLTLHEWRAHEDEAAGILDALHSINANVWTEDTLNIFEQAAKDIGAQQERERLREAAIQDFADGNIPLTVAAVIDRLLSDPDEADR